MATLTPIKTYTEYNRNSFTGKRHELLQDGKTILWVNKSQQFLSRPEVHIQTQSEKGPIIAASKSMGMGGGVRALIGKDASPINPASTPKEQWWNVLSNGWSKKEYEFRLGAGRYVWRRTHDNALGASTLGGMDFKLMDLSNARDGDKSSQKLLAVYVHSKRAFNRHDIGRIDFMVELGQDLELLALASILGIQDSIQRSRKSGSAGGAGGGGGC